MSSEVTPVMGVIVITKVFPVAAREHSCILESYMTCIHMLDSWLQLELEILLGALQRDSTSHCQHLAPSHNVQDWVWEDLAGHSFSTWLPAGVPCTHVPQTFQLLGVGLQVRCWIELVVTNFARPNCISQRCHVWFVGKPIAWCNESGCLTQYVIHLFLLNPTLDFNTWAW